jgi:hypothetical protein
VLLPTTHLDALRAVAADRMPDAVIETLARQIPTRDLDVGDPGVTHDVDTPFGDLPTYEGPPDPPGGHTHEWGEGAATEGGLPAAGV